jgi:hypothetical protein
MTLHRLFVAGERERSLTSRDFLWAMPPQPSSFWTHVDPLGRALRTTSQPALEFLRLALGVYLVDRTTPREAGWSRDLSLSIPVDDVVAWNSRTEGVSGLLDFLTGDRWTLSFRHLRAPRRPQPAERSSHDLVALFSGGMDSFAGAARAVESFDEPLLIGHWNWTLTASSQHESLEALAQLSGKRPRLRSIRVGRKATQIGGRLRFGEEPSSRSRSLLFLALGVAAATGTSAVELWVPENGWVSLNVPLDGSRRGSLSTRTTHPGLLDEFSGLIADLGIGVSIRNPWDGQTKGDLVRWVADKWNEEAASRAFSATNSCAKSDMRFLELPPNVHCGVCYACLVRRGAFQAAGVVDETPYAEQLLVGVQRKGFLRNRLRDYGAVQNVIGRGGFELEDVLALNLPDRIRPQDALTLANRGLAELSAIEIT